MNPETVKDMAAGNAGTDAAQRQLDDLEAALGQRYSDLGRSILETVEQEGHQIDRLVADIIRLRKQLNKQGYTPQPLKGEYQNET